MTHADAVTISGLLTAWLIASAFATPLIGAWLAGYRHFHSGPRNEGKDKTQ